MRQKRKDERGGEWVPRENCWTGAAPKPAVRAGLSPAPELRPRSSLQHVVPFSTALLTVARLASHAHAGLRHCQWFRTVGCPSNLRLGLRSQVPPLVACLSLASIPEWRPPVVSPAHCPARLSLSCRSQLPAFRENVPVSVLTEREPRIDDLARLERMARGGGVCTDWPAGASCGRSARQQPGVLWRRHYVRTPSECSFCFTAGTTRSRTEARSRVRLCDQRTLAGTRRCARLAACSSRRTLTRKKAVRTP